MLYDKKEETRRLEQKKNARRAQRTELRVRLMQLRNMSFERLARYFLAPFGIKLEIAHLSIYLMAFGVVLFLAYTYFPRSQQDPLVGLTEKWGRPCGKDIATMPLDETATARIDSAFRSLVQDARPVDGMPWDIRASGRVEYVYSADRIAALSSLMSEVDWLSSQNRVIIMLKISQFGLKVRQQNTKRH
jgi:hypothetical protein